MEVLNLTVEPDGVILDDQIDFNIALLVIVTEDGSTDFYEEKSSITIGGIMFDIKKYFERFGNVKDGKIVIPLRKEKGPQSMMVLGLKNVKEAVLIYTMERVIIFDLVEYGGFGPIITNVVNRGDRYERKKIPRQVSKCYSDGGFYLDGDYVVLPPGGVLELEYYEGEEVEYCSYKSTFLVSFAVASVLALLFL